MKNIGCYSYCIYDNMLVLLYCCVIVITVECLLQEDGLRNIVLCLKWKVVGQGESSAFPSLSCSWRRFGLGISGDLAK